MNIKLSKPFARSGKVDEFDVRQIKKALNRLGYYTPLKTTGIIGTPDAAVFEALKKFQTDHDLPATGSARPDDETVKKLSSTAGKKKDGQYIWRSVGDSKVRDAHAVMSGTVRDFADSPDPGEEFNCRCWVESVPQGHRGFSDPKPKFDCDAERQAVKNAEKKVEDLSKKLHDLLLELNKLAEEHSRLIKNAQKSLGVRVVAYILTLPFDKLGILGELLQRFFEDIVSDMLIEAAEIFMNKSWILKQKIEEKRQEIAEVFAELEQAAKLLEDAKKNLERCENAQQS